MRYLSFNTAFAGFVKLEPEAEFLTFQGCVLFHCIMFCVPTHLLVHIELFRFFSLLLVLCLKGAADLFPTQYKSLR